MLAAMTALLASCGGSGVTAAAATPTSTPTGVASISLSASPTTVKSDNSSSTTITLTALTATNAAVPNVAVALSADTGILSTSTVTTDTTGKATFTFSSGTTSKANRTATITANAGVTAQMPLQIVGSTLTAVSTGSTVPNTGTSPVTMTFTAKDAGGNAIAGAAIGVTASGTGTLTITPVTTPAGFTDASGQYVVTVAGATAGTATVTASAVGAAATSAITVSASTSTFSISQTVLTSGGVAQPAVANPTAVAMKIGDSLAVTVNAPAPTTSVTFATTVGTWTGGTNAITVAVVGGTATANLTTAAAGAANIQVIDANPANPPVSASLAVSMTAVTPYSITLQAAPSVVPKSVGTTTGVSTLTATVRDAAGQPVGGVAVAFSITNPTGGGETVSPAIAYTTSTQTAGLGLGQATASFTSGSLSTGATGSQIRASVLGTAVATQPIGLPNATPSGFDAAVVIGGSAGSVAFGQATSLAVNSNATAYIQAMSVMVADANGNPAPLGTVVNLSLWPIAWSTGSGCVPDADTATTGTFWNEDTDENVILGPTEDGVRVYYATKPYVLPGLTGTKDGLLTPPNSAAGTIPSTVITDANGVATFDLTYPKTSGVWIIDRIRARTIVQGSDAVGEVQFRLGILRSDGQPCILPPSPYNF